MAALALLVTLAIPMGMWAAEGDVHDMGITQSTLLNNNAAIPSINIDAQSYSVKKVTINWRYNKDIENPVTIEVLVGENSWGTQTITGNTTADAVFEGESTIGAIVINFTNNTGGGTGHGTFYVNSVKLTEGESSGPAPTTYTVTFDAGDGTFVGNTDFPNASNTVAAGTYTLPSAERSGYIFDGWVTGNNDPITGSYTVSGNVDFTAAYTENDTPTPGGNLNLTFDLTSNPGDWPTSASTTLTNFDYTLAGVDYSFALNNVYCNSGYLMLKSVAVLGLPAIEGYKLTTVVAHNSNGCSTSTKVGISSSATQASYIAGGAVQTWSTQGSTYTYNLTSTEENTMYYMYVTNKNAQLFSLDLIYEAVAATTIATPIFDPTSGTEFGDEGLNVSITCETNDVSIYYTLNGDTPNNQSTLYNGAISLTETTTINAIAYDGTNYSNVATATYTYVDPNAPGTVNNPYTVAQARAAIDANAGTQGVYATGIVSAIPTAWSTDYNNITFNFVDNVGDNDFLQAYRCASGTGVDASQVAVGDVVVVYGDLTKYGSTYEFGQGCTLVTLTHPVITEPTITVNPDVVDVDGLLHVVQLPITYHNIVVENYGSFGVQFYDAEGEETEMPDWLVVMVTGVIGGDDDDYVVNCAIPANQGEAHTTYLKVYAYDAEQNKVYSNLITISQAAPTYAELPFEFNGGTSDIEDTDGLYQEGLGDYSANTNPTTQLKFDGTGDWLLLQFNERPGTLTFDIKNNSFSGGTFKVQTSENGVTFTDLKTYTEIIGTQNEEFTNLGENVRYIKWIYTEKVSGNVGLGNIALAEYTEPQQYTLTVEPFENLELITFVNEEMIMEGDGEITVTEGDEIMLSIVANEGYVMETLMVNGVNHVNDIADDFTYTFEMPAENVTISATAVEYVAPTPSNYVRITALDQLTDGSIVVIASRYDETATNYRAMKNTISNGKASSVAFESTTSGNNEVLPATIADNVDDYYWVVSVNNGVYTFTNASGDVIGWSSSSNFNMNGDNTTWNVAKSTSGEALVPGYAGFTIKNVNEESRYIAYRSTEVFGPYSNSNMNGDDYNFFLDFFVETEPVTVTYPLDIIGYVAGSDGGYYLIASPVTVNPANVGMTDGEYDLYSFDQAEADEWRNYKVNAFNLEPGKGYLYAKQATTEGEVFHFDLTGTPYNGEPIRLSRSENVDFPGWNLVGNPFGQTAYIDRDFYVMKSDGSEIIESETNEIDVMQGVFVIADNDGEALTFSTEAPTTTDGKIVMNVSNARRSVVDRATVRFGEGRTLPKFMLNDENTKIYFTEGNEEFAVVRSINENLTPVSFHAAENGTYTLSINTENVDFSFFHLIDNMTGNDIDLLSTPSYTFEASTTDYAQRFSLLYATLDGVGENNAEAFAFFNGNEWVVNNEGEANLQVIDMAGRLISSETVNGTVTVSLNQSAGIYMLRLVNGNDVKVQKVGVR